MKYSIKSQLGVNVLLIFIFTLFVYRSILTSNTIQYGIVFMAVTLILFLGTGKVYLSKNGYDLLLFLAIGYFAFAIRNVTSSNLYQFILYILIVAFFICARNSTENFKNIKYIVIFFATLSSITVIIQWVFPEQFNNMMVPMFNEWNRDYIRYIFSCGYYMGFNNLVGDTAGYLTMGLLMIISGYMVQKKFKVKQIIILLILGFALLLTGKRAHILFLVATYVFLILVRNWDKNFLVRVLKILLVCVFIIIALIAGVKTMSHIPAVARLIETYQDLLVGEDISSGRDILYEYAIYLFKNNWLFGIGWDIYPILTVSYLGYESSHDVNNSYLQLLCETGIVGTIIFLIPMFIAFFKCLGLVKQWAKKKITISEINACILFYCCGYQCFFWLYFFTESPMYDTIYLYMYFVTMAFVYALDKEQKCIIGGLKE